MTEPANWDVKLVNTKLLSELQKDLRGLNLLGLKVGLARDETDTGADVLESTVTRLTKWITGLVAGFGGISAATVGATWDKLSDHVKVATMYGLGFVLAAGVLAIGILVSSDLRSRAAGQVAIYNARRDITTEYMRLVAGRAEPGPCNSDKADPGGADDPASAGGPDETKALFAKFASELVASLSAQLMAQLPPAPTDQPGSRTPSPEEPHGDHEAPDDASSTAPPGGSPGPTPPH